VARHRLHNPDSKVANIQLTIPFFADLNKQTIEVVDKAVAVQEDVEEEMKEEENEQSGRRINFSPQNKRHKKNPQSKTPNATRRNKKEATRKAVKKQFKPKVLRKKYSPTTLASWYSIIWQFCRHSGWGDIKKECPIIGDMIKKWMKVSSYIFMIFNIYIINLLRNIRLKDLRFLPKRSYYNSLNTLMMNKI
jgi:hypothetical protein